MNQGARDANAESARMGARNTQEQILDELKTMNFLLRRIANNTSKDGSVFADVFCSDDEAPAVSNGEL